MDGIRRTIITTRAGAIVMTGHGAPRCLRVLDTQGRPVTADSDVDLGTAFRMLNSLCSGATPPVSAGARAQ